MSAFALDKSSLAFDTSSSDSNNDAGSLQLGSVTVTPSIKLSTVYNDNKLSSDTNIKSSLVGIVVPSVSFMVQDSIKRLTLEYGIESGTHQDSNRDDFADQKLLGVFTYAPTSKITTQLSAEYLDRHDPRGTARTEGLVVDSIDADEWHSYGINGLVTYGSPNAIGRIELETGFAAKEYDNNRQFTSDRDRNDFSLRGTFYYKIRPKTRLLFEIRQTDYEYQNRVVGVPSLDSTDRNYFFGVTWDRTYKTTGYLKLGYTDKDFDSGLRNDASGFTWESGTVWRPRTYSRVNISTQRRHDETNGIGDSIDVGEFKVSWNHEWRDQISSEIDFLFGDDDYAATSREDSRFSTGLKLNYDWRRWARISAGYRYDERESSMPGFDYERNLFDLTLNFTL